ncbi:hypothetical protein LCGC14_1168160, partial [marine sediment metagenome]
MKEHLARFHRKNGETIDMHRVDGNVEITTK